MYENEVKTSIDGLEIGMYVTRLDRPWLETPFPLEGVRIKSAQDIELLRRYASYVYIDVQRGQAPDRRYWITGEGHALRLQHEELPPIKVNFKDTSNEYTKLKKRFYELKTSLDQELGSAREAQEKISASVENLFQDIKNDKRLDVESLKEGVTAVVESLIRNPSAFALLVQVHKSDEYTYSRSLGSSVWCAQFGRHLGLERGEINNLALGGLLLDVGKVKLPPELLKNRELISPTESLLMRRHVDDSVRILAGTKTIPHSVMRMVATHHERADGSGYPEGLSNDKIPIYGRIAGIVDSYDAMTSKKPYTDNIHSPHEAIHELYQCRNTSFQAELVEQFIQTVGVYPTGSLVELDGGEVGVVIEINDLKRLFPTVMLILDKDKQPLGEFEKINLSLGGSHKIKAALPYGAFGIKMSELFL